jgi:hypothetical protein
VSLVPIGTIACEALAQCCNSRGGELHLAKRTAAELQRCHPSPPTTALNGSGAGNGAPHMVLAVNRRACGPRGRRPMGSLGRRHRGRGDVRPTRRAAAVHSRSVGWNVANLAHAACNNLGPASSWRA